MCTHFCIYNHHFSKTHRFIALCNRAYKMKGVYTNCCESL